MATQAATATGTAARAACWTGRSRHAHIAPLSSAAVVATAPMIGAGESATTSAITPAASAAAAVGRGQNTARSRVSAGSAQLVHGRGRQARGPRRRAAGQGEPAEGGQVGPEAADHQQQPGGGGEPHRGSRGPRRRPGPARPHEGRRGAGRLPAARGSGVPAPPTTTGHPDRLVGGDGGGRLGADQPGVDPGGAGGPARAGARSARSARRRGGRPAAAGSAGRRRGMMTGEQREADHGALPWDPRGGPMASVTAGTTPWR